jgi:hypothetical protein
LVAILAGGFLIIGLRTRRGPLVGLETALAVLALIAVALAYAWKRH